MTDIEKRRLARIAALVLASACSVGTPRIDGGPGAPAAPNDPWPVPRQARTPRPPAAPPTSVPATAALVKDSAEAGAVRTLSLTDVVDLALRNSPATRESWATARAAAESYGVARGALYPTVTGGVNLTESRTSGSSGLGTNGTNGAGVGGTGGVDSSGTGGAGTGASFGGASTTRTLLAPSLSLSYLVFDLGGRAGTIEAAKQRAIAADLAHNLTVQNVVLQVEASLFSYLATRALRDAQTATVQEAQADLAAARERHRVGVATLQEELQARTQLSQQQLQLETLESDLLAAQGNLAVAMGFPANLRFDVPNVAATDSVLQVEASVDTMINRAIVLRPDLAAARADAAALAAEVRVARSAGYPALTLRSTASATSGLAGTSTSGRNYSLVLGVQIPIFNGFATQHQVRAAEDQYTAGLARARSVEQQISLQVFTSYFAMRSATQRVRTSSELLASAQQSADVALGRYRAGVGTIVDLLLARSALATARAEAIQARWEWRTALVQLAHDVGTLDLAGRPNVPLGTDTTGGGMHR